MKIQPTIPNMLPEERVILMLHRHGFVAFQFVLVYLFFAILPIVGWWFLGDKTTIFQDPTSFGYALVALLISAYALIWVLLFFVAWLNFYLDVWIVTNERIINIVQQRLFHRMVSEQKLYRVQDVTWEMKGVVANLFRFGNVHVQTAGEDDRFTFENISQPEKVAHEIMSLLESIEKQIGLDKMAEVEGEVGTKAEIKKPLGKRK
ncbi:MAG: PH domain-containing protein [Patescibacteria group bacterium]|jgi:uncharacterized membrane protein YdbT with pleckstrin-like domain